MLLRRYIIVSHFWRPRITTARQSLGGEMRSGREFSQRRSALQTRPGAFIIALRSIRRPWRSFRYRRAHRLPRVKLQASQLHVRMGLRFPADVTQEETTSGPGQSCFVGSVVWLVFGLAPLTGQSVTGGLFIHLSNYSISR